MPRIETIEPVTYSPNDPYDVSHDNIPLINLARRQNLINLALDNVISQMTDAIGSQGSLSNRLNQSINADGSLKINAVDETLHSIESHTDTVDYVRMKKTESDKLALISDNATDFFIEVETDDITTFDSGSLRLVESPTVSFTLVSPNKLKFDLAFPPEAAHRHYYDQEPVHADIVNPDFINYKVNSISSSFIEGSLRIMINGIRLSSVKIYVPGALINDPWTLINFTANAEEGTFVLSTALSDSDVIRIDYDRSF